MTDIGKFTGGRPEAGPRSWLSAPGYKPGARLRLPRPPLVTPSGHFEDNKKSGLSTRPQPLREGSDGPCARIAWPGDHIEAIARQAQLERFHEHTDSEFVGHEHITENPDSLPGDHRLDGVQFLAETQVSHILELGHFPPPALSRGKPSLPCGRLAIGRRPIGVDQNMVCKVDWSLQAAR